MSEERRDDETQTQYVIRMVREDAVREYIEHYSPKNEKDVILLQKQLDAQDEILNKVRQTAEDWVGMWLVAPYGHILLKILAGEDDLK